jgi:hypothetical protein
MKHTRVNIYITFTSFIIRTVVFSQALPTVQITTGSMICCFLAIRNIGQDKRRKLTDGLVVGFPTRSHLDIVSKRIPNAFYRYPRTRPGFKGYISHCTSSFVSVADDEMKQIYYTMKHIELYTCLRFVFRTESDSDFLYIRNVEGKCQSFVGNVRRGAQVCNIFYKKDFDNFMILIKTTFDVCLFIFTSISASRFRP